MTFSRIRRRLAFGISILGFAVTWAAEPATAHAEAAPPEVGAASLIPAESDPKNLLTLASTLAARADYAGAESAFHRILDQPGFTEADKKKALLGLDQVQRKQSTFISATAISQTAVSATPTAVVAKGEAKGLLALGSNLTDRSAFTDAEIAYRQVLANSKFTLEDKKNALLGLGRVHRKQGSFIKAAAIYEKFLKEYPDDERSPETLLDLGRSLRAMGAYRLAISRFYSVINSTLKVNSDGFAHYQLLARTAQFEIAETHYEAGQFAEASKFFLRLRLLDLAPVDRARAHFKAACAQQLDHDFEAAVVTLHAYLDQWPEDENVPEARYLLATMLRQINRAQEALKVTLDLLKTEQARTADNPRRWAYWQRRTGNQLANEFFQNGDTLNALAIYQGLSALSSDPGWRLPVMYQMALCYERLRQPDHARETYQAICASGKSADEPAGVTDDVTELARMAKWRLGQLDWHDHVDHALNTLFETTTGQTAATTPVPAHDPNGSPAPAPATL